MSCSLLSDESLQVSPVRVRLKISKSYAYDRLLLRLRRTAEKGTAACDWRKPLPFKFTFRLAGLEMSED